MNLHDVLIIMQYIGLLGLFLESIVVFQQWKGLLHGYLLVSCLSALVNNLGYLFELKAETEEGYLTALKLSYAGRVWFGLFMFLFVAELTNRKIPKVWKAIFVLTNLMTYMIILTFREHGLYYTGVSFQNNDIFPRFLHGNGPWHHFYMGMQVFYSLLGIAWLLHALHQEKTKTARWRLLMVFFAVLAESLFFVIQIAGLGPAPGLYDTSMLGYFIGTIFMYIAIFSFDLLGTREIAREFVIDRISEGIIAVDNEGAIVYYNEPAKHLYPEIENASSLPIVLKKALAEKESVVFDDHIYSIEENRLIHGGENYGNLYALVDETEHIRYMEKLKEQKEIADYANAAKGRFLANMSHEIRTPINAVLGFDEMILRESGEETVRSYAISIMSAGRTLLSLINDILDLSKVEEGKMEIIPVQYQLSSLMNDLVGMIKERAEKKGLQLNVEVDSQIPHLLYGDEIRIRQCVLNLLTNAVKYTEQGSVTLIVFYEKKDEKHILLGFSVKDTGIGMKKEDMEKLCTPYQRIEEKRNRSIEGTGLGMSIVSNLLDLMGSGLQAESEYGRGTKISFQVEQEVVNWEEIGDYSNRLHEMKQESYTYHELFHAPDAKILVVDDTEMNLTVIQSLLKKTKVQIDTSMSGKDALRLTESKEYDVLLIDHMMPDMDGMETLKHIRKSGKNQETPAVALTANALSGAREMYLDAGFTDYLSKPVDGGSLEKLLESLLPQEKLKCPEDDEVSVEGQGEEEQELPEEMEGIPEWMKELSGLDTKVGVRNCGSAEGYLSVLSVFHQTAEKQAEEIAFFYQAGDIENYVIKVHALKGSARIVGAGQLSGLAADLEAAGKREDISYIREYTDELLSMYRALDQELMPLDETEDEEEELLPMDQSMLKEVYRKIVEVADSMDYGQMDEILQKVHEYQLSDSDKKNIKQLEQMFTEFDWDAIAETAKSLEADCEYH